MSLISITIPLYNRKELISETINSLFAQTYKNWEAIIVDDSSTDNSYTIVKQLAEKDKRIKLLIRNRKPKGATTCRNIGIEKATGDYIIFLDSDDLLKPFALQQRIDTIKKHPNLDYWIFQTVNFEDRPENEKEIWNKVNNEDNISRFLNLDSVWHTTGPIWKAETVKKYLNFDEKLACWQDVDFHLQALFKKLKYKTFFDLPSDVLYRRHSTGSISQGGFNKEKRKSQIYFVKKHFKLFNKPIYKNIIELLVFNLIKKNTQSRYLRNLVNLTFWSLKNKIISFKQVIQTINS
jgi:glycosyltransferase involved in cell wall biosynthesis